MTLLAIYSSPTTPGGAGWGVDITGGIRLGSISGVAGEAELGATGTGSMVLDDPLGIVGHNSDGIVGLKQWSLRETDCPIGNQRLWTGYVGPRNYRRGQSDSLITGVARKIDVTLIDVNDFLGFRVFPPTADDPTSDFVQGANTDIERIASMLSTVDFLTTTLFDDGYVNTTGPVNLDARDYTGDRPFDVLQDCAQMSGKNFFIFYNEALNHYTLWYDFYSSDGSATITYDASVLLTNVEAERDDTTVFAIEPDAVGTLDPSRVVSAIRGTGSGVTGYKTKATTANTFAWRDASPLSSSVKTQAKMDALLTRYLDDNATEDNRISCTVRLPSNLATAMKVGQRIQCHFTHVPGVQSTFTWCRILQMTIRQDQETDQWYWFDLELSPIEPPCVRQNYTLSSAVNNCFTQAWAQQPSPGSLLISFEAARGNLGLMGTGDTPIGVATTAVGVCPAPGNLIAGTEWTLVPGSSFYIGVADGITDHPGDPVSMAYRTAAASEPQKTTWRGQQGRVHYVELTCVTGAPTVVVTLANVHNSGLTFVSPDLPSPAAGIWAIGYASNLSGLSDGAGTDGTMTTTTPNSVQLSDGWQDVNFHPYSWFGLLTVAGAGTDHITLVRNHGGWIHDAAGWVAAFWPS